MAMREMDPEDTALEALFAAARADASQPSASLVARVMADADTVLMELAAPAASPVAARRTSPAATKRAAPGFAASGFAARLFAGLGGWGGISGLVTASCAGLWLGMQGADGPMGGNLIWTSAADTIGYDVVADASSLWLDAEVQQ